GLALLEVEVEASALELPRGTAPLRREVAGHRAVRLQRLAAVEHLDVTLTADRRVARWARDADSDQGALLGGDGRGRRHRRRLLHHWRGRRRYQRACATDTRGSRGTVRVLLTGSRLGGLLAS